MVHSLPGLGIILGARAHRGLLRSPPRCPVTPITRPCAPPGNRLVGILRGRLASHTPTTRTLPGATAARKPPAPLGIYIHGMSSGGDQGMELFEDESGQALYAPVARTWGCRGHTLVVRVSGWGIPGGSQWRPWPASSRAAGPFSAGGRLRRLDHRRAPLDR